MLRRVGDCRDAWRRRAARPGAAAAPEPGPFRIRVQTEADLEAAGFEMLAWQDPFETESPATPFWRQDAMPEGMLDPDAPPLLPDDRQAGALACDFQIAQGGRIRVNGTTGGQAQVAWVQAVAEQQHRICLAVPNRRPDETVRHRIVTPRAKRKRAAMFVCRVRRSEEFRSVDPQPPELRGEERHELKGRSGLEGTDLVLVEVFPSDGFILVSNAAKHRLKCCTIKRCCRVGSRDALPASVVERRESARSTLARIERVSGEIRFVDPV